MTHKTMIYRHALAARSIGNWHASPCNLNFFYAIWTFDRQKLQQSARNDQSRRGNPSDILHGQKREILSICLAKNKHVRNNFCHKKQHVFKDDIQTLMNWTYFFAHCKRFPCINIRKIVSTYQDCKNYFGK